MKYDKKETFMTYVNANIAPILVDFIDSNSIKGATIIPANINVQDLNGHYEGFEFLPPIWFNELEKKILKYLL